MFSTLLGKILAHATPVQPAAPAASAPAPVADASAAPTPVPVSTPVEIPVASTAPGADGAAPPSVDVTAILDGLAAKSSEHGLDWKKSIVDMLKLLGMDSSLSARKELAKDLSYSGDESDSATMNVWLHKEVIRKLAENGGKVPAELLH